MGLKAGSPASCVFATLVTEPEKTSELAAHGEPERDQHGKLTVAS